jgi:hypothetical protein
VTECRPAGVGWEADVDVAGTTVTCRLPDRPAAGSGELVLTATDPPYFGPDGAAVRPESSSRPASSLPASSAPATASESPGGRGSQ